MFTMSTIRMGAKTTATMTVLTPPSLPALFLRPPLRLVVPVVALALVIPVVVAEIMPRPRLFMGVVWGAPPPYPVHDVPHFPHFLRRLRHRRLLRARGLCRVTG